MPPDRSRSRSRLFCIRAFCARYVTLFGAAASLPGTRSNRPPSAGRLGWSLHVLPTTCARNSQVQMAAEAAPDCGRSSRRVSTPDAATSGTQPRHALPVCHASASSAASVDDEVAEPSRGRADRSDVGGTGATLLADPNLNAAARARARRRGLHARAAPCDAHALQLRRSLGSHFELGALPCLAAPAHAALPPGRAAPPWERRATAHAR
jgi:hypothetical protein